MDLPLSAAVDYLIYAIEQEKEQAAWELWTEMYPFMVSGLIKEFIKFEDFKNKLFQKQYRYTQKSLDEIEEEMLAIVAAYKGR
jgi:hypothetical protein